MVRKGRLGKEGNQNEVMVGGVAGTKKASPNIIIMVS